MKKIDKNTLGVIALMGVVGIVSLFYEPVSFDGALQSWVGALVGGLVSLGSSIAGAAMGNKAAKEQSQAYDDAWADYEDWYDGQMNTSILDRADTLSMLKRYRDWQEENAKKYQTNAIKGGASEEAKIAYAQEANKGYADAISRIAAMGQQYKDRLSQNYATNRFNFQTKRADMAAAGAQAVASGIANAGGTLGSLIGGMDWGGVKPQTDLLPSLPTPTSTSMKIDGSGGVSPIRTSDFYFG